ncbi:hypothetical protein HanHA300_Chr13g0506231 [Helianthus annuus]|nr:hypothetical protein HanHA300_Chr13g0506231 [Helianthus annuus]KAJ0662162.1 hypothetical protein HanLR1_Chr13g0466371 [Helianthus annuus]
MVIEDLKSFNFVVGSCPHINCLCECYRVNSMIYDVGTVTNSLNLPSSGLYLSYFTLLLFDLVISKCKFSLR